jgi:antitoxin VapB
MDGFDGMEVLGCQYPVTGDVIPSRKPETWDGFFDALKGVDVPASFLDVAERNQGTEYRVPFKGWRE